MKKIGGKRIKAKLPEELFSRAKAQAARENRSMAEFIRRVLHRYLLEAEFGRDLLPEARESIHRNRELLHLLRDS